MENNGPGVDRRRVIKPDESIGFVLLYIHIGVALLLSLALRYLMQTPLAGAASWTWASWLWGFPLLATAIVNWKAQPDHANRGSLKIMIIAVSQIFFFIQIFSVLGVSHRILFTAPDLFCLFFPVLPGLQAGLVLIISRVLDVVYGRLRLFARPGECMRCGYDLTGNVSGVCPECGLAFEIAATEARS